MSRSRNRFFKKSPTSGKVLGPPMFNIRIPVFAVWVSVVAVLVLQLLFSQWVVVIIFIIPFGNRNCLGFEITEADRLNAVEAIIEICIAISQKSWHVHIQKLCNSAGRSIYAKARIRRRNCIFANNHENVSSKKKKIVYIDRMAVVYNDKFNSCHCTWFDNCVSDRLGINNSREIRMGD